MNLTDQSPHTWCPPSAEETSTTKKEPPVVYQKPYEYVPKDSATPQDQKAGVVNPADVKSFGWESYEEETLEVDRTRKIILDEAAKCVLADREKQHGSPEDTFGMTARLHKIYLAGINRELLPHDVAILNILQKISRIANNPFNSDSWVDIAGYAACGGELAEKERRSQKE